MAQAAEAKKRGKNRDATEAQLQRLNREHALTRYKYLLFSISTILLTISCAMVAHYRHDVSSLKLADEYLDAKKPDEALQALKAVLQQKPDDNLAQRLAAEAYLQKDDYVHAESLARHILKTDEDDEEALYVLGKVAIHSGNCSAAYQLVGEAAFKHALDGSKPTKLLALVYTSCNGDKLR